jgi:hypothetical protein
VGNSIACIPYGDLEPLFDPSIAFSPGTTNNGTAGCGIEAYIPSKSRTAMDEDEPDKLNSTRPAVLHPPSASHPRRPPAHKSVSLLHGASGKTPHPEKFRGKILLPNRVDLSPSSSSIPTPSDNKTGSSGESSNADKWFEKTNNNVRTRSTDLMDSKRNQTSRARNASTK